MTSRLAPDLQPADPLGLPEDAMLEGVARQVVGDIQTFFSQSRLEQAAIAKERVRLAHELHDGILQSLAGLGLQLEALRNALESDPQGARERLHAIQALLLSEQRELRAWIENLAPKVSAAVATAHEVEAALARLCRNAEAQWALRIELTPGADGRMPRALGEHVYRLVQEALANVGRHAHARCAHVAFGIHFNRIDLAITDDGIGFPYRGHFDLAALTAKGIGPRSIRERVASLAGELVIDTSATGTQLWISLPIDRNPWGDRRGSRSARTGHD